MILIDSSVWIDHLRSKNEYLFNLLQEGRVYMHPFVLGELACGHLKNRSTILSLLADLPMIKVATEIEVLHLIESRKLMGKGIGYVDVHLLASLMLSPGIKLHTSDLRLQSVAAELKLAEKITMY